MRGQQLEGGDVEEVEEEDEKPAPLVWLGERLVRNPLTQATVDMWEEEQMIVVMSISSEAVPVADGEAIEATLPMPAAAEDCDASDRQRLFTLLATSSRAE